KISEDSLKRKVAINCDPSGKGKLSLSFEDETDLIDLLKSLGVSIK
ncbi:MAG: hypothetical protein HOH60_10205, partial [Opitutae bacterium]|nr:hypothetical protein [Opitutae bacterium]